MASIKPSDAEPGSGSGITTTMGRTSAHNVTLKRCVRGAYDVEEARIVGGPKWIDEDRYQIDAKASGPAGDHDLMIMLQSLLPERFKLSFHREKRMLPGYQKVVGKGGLKAKASKPGAGSRTSANANRGTMLHLPVSDSTAIEGRFDFTRNWIPEEVSAKAGTAVSGPAIFEALQEQLGLKLQASKVPAEVLVIDRAEKPTEN